MSKYNIVIGIDIGLSGAICIKRPVIHQEIEMTTYPMPIVGKHVDWDEMYKIFNEYEGMRGIVVFEKLGQIFKSSKATAFSMGAQQEGMIVMCKMLAIPYAQVAPKEWQKEMFRGIDTIYKPGSKLNDTKKMALEKIKQIYPKMKLTFGERATKPNDNLVDAVLIAEYAERFL